MSARSRCTVAAVFALSAAIVLGGAGQAAQRGPLAGPTATPTVGQKAPDFSLVAVDGATVRLSGEVARGPVVLVVLRGWPGYQCPFCTRQFGEYMTKAADVTATGAHVLFVYPGPADGLKAHAEGLLKSTTLPAAYRVLLDPDYTFTLAYGLRWEAPMETAHPSTFVIDKGGTVVFARTSHAHDDRVPVADVLTALAKLPR
jgi:peroxiredoxin